MAEKGHIASFCKILQNEGEIGENVTKWGQNKAKQVLDIGRWSERSGNGWLGNDTEWPEMAIISWVL